MDVIPSAAQSVARIVNLQHEIAGQHVPAGPKIGKIVAPPPNIQIAIDNIILNKEQIYINEYWLAGHRREAKGHINSGTQSASCSVGAPHTHPISNDYTDDIIYTDTLKVGDLVSVYTCEGDQLYIVESKLVKL